MKSILLGLLMFFCGVAAAQGPPASVSREISQLFTALGQSGCQFYRNGSWYGPVRASAHLRDKYDYLLRRGLVTSTESFIELAASRSSLSGQPYLVKCGNAAPVESRVWFGRRLLELRAVRTGSGT